MTITEALTKISTAVYGKDVRNAIHDGIELCYNERTSGGYDPVTDINNFVSGIALFSSTATNRPYAANFMLLAAGNSTNCVQVAIAMNNNYVPMIRRKQSGTWQAWANLKLS